MKTSALPILTALALTTESQAGSDYSAKHMPEAAPPCLWSWFAGGSGGYLSGDWNDDIYTLQVGTERICPNSNASHSIYLEVSHTEKIDSYQSGLTFITSLIAPSFAHIDYEIQVIPITMNYKYEQTLAGNLNWHIGAGAGIAMIESSANLSGFRAKESVFYAHAFAGLTYNVNESFEIFSGVKYIFMDDTNDFSNSPYEEEATLDKNLHIELGARFNF